MTGFVAAVTAGVLYAVAVLVLLVLRTVQQLWATGSSGFNGFRGSRTPAAQLAGICFVLAVLIGLAAPLLAGVAGTALPLGDIGGGGLELPWLLAGTVAMIGGLIVGVIAQQQMGASWRIGVDPREQTTLITSGLFAVIRNPIFTALVAVQLGTVLLVPTWLSLLGLALMVAGCQLQTRVVEEPYLARIHGDRYRRYVSRAGRFLPGLGRLRINDPSNANRNAVGTRGGRW